MPERVYTALSPYGREVVTWADRQRESQAARDHATNLALQRMNFQAQQADIDFRRRTEAATQRQAFQQERLGQEQEARREAADLAYQRSLEAAREGQEFRRGYRQEAWEREDVQRAAEEAAAEKALQRGMAGFRQPVDQPMIGPPAPGAVAYVPGRPTDFTDVDRPLDPHEERLIQLSGGDPSAVWEQRFKERDAAMKESRAERQRDVEREKKDERADRLLEGMMNLAEDVAGGSSTRVLQAYESAGGGEIGAKMAEMALNRIEKEAERKRREQEAAVPTPKERKREEQQEQAQAEQRADNIAATLERAVGGYYMTDDPMTKASLARSIYDRLESAKSEYGKAGQSDSFKALIADLSLNPGFIGEFVDEQGNLIRRTIPQDLPEMGEARLDPRGVRLSLGPVGKIAEDLSWLYERALGQ